MQYHIKKTGFTLVEMSIVLIIIAIVAGVALGGYNLVSGAEVKRLSKEIQSYITAVSGFERKYKELPGDMTDATSYFNSDCRTTTNGNGNRQIVWGGTPNEGAAAFEHMECAGFFSNTGLDGTGANAVIGTNVPASSTGLGGYYIDFIAAFGNALGLGSADGSGVNNGAAISAKVAYSLDTELDDGNGSTGNIIAPGAASCHTGGNYSVTTAGSTCNLRIRLGE